ncbi:MAG: hypothetical protein M1419_02275 [Bacteroidetes bacterium]|nr:hypothetical protein [Bacteroidota bacterium]
MIKTKIDINKSKIILSHLFKLGLISIIVLILITYQLFAGKPFSFSKEFTLFTSKNAGGYFKPFFTTIEESLNSNQYTKADYKDEWSFALDVAIQGMIIPSSQKNYDAELPDEYGNTSVTQTAELRDNKESRNGKSPSSQPTLYGGISYPVFSAPQSSEVPDSYYKSVAFAEGKDKSFIGGLPVLQLIVGLPTKTDFRIRSIVLPVQDESLVYWGLIVNQRIDHYFHIFSANNSQALALNISFQSITRDAGIDISTFAIGAHWSNLIYNNLYVYSGLQYESMTGTFEAVRENFSTEDVANSPYPEIREGRNLKFDIESFTSFRVIGGLSYILDPVEFHVDAAYASQPIINGGFKINIGSF